MYFIIIQEISNNVVIVYLVHSRAKILLLVCKLFLKKRSKDLLYLYVCVTE